MTLCLFKTLVKHRSQVELTDIEKISINADRITSIIDSVRDMNAGAHGILSLSNIKISKISKELHDIFSYRFEQKKQIFIHLAGFDLEIKTHPQVLCNSVLSNIVFNAIKFSPRGSSIEMSASKEGDFVRIEVHDQGKGFPKELLKKITDGASYASSPGTEDEKGDLKCLKLWTALHARSFLI